MTVSLLTESQKLYVLYCIAEAG